MPEKKKFNLDKWLAEGNRMAEDARQSHLKNVALIKRDNPNITGKEAEERATSFEREAYLASEALVYQTFKP